jgi:hypothetical protein
VGGVFTFLGICFYFNGMQRKSGALLAQLAADLCTYFALNWHDGFLLADARVATSFNYALFGDNSTQWRDEQEKQIHWRE